MLLGTAQIKAARRMLMKSTPRETEEEVSAQNCLDQRSFFYHFE